MAKDLFSDLEGVDVSSKYDEQNAKIDRDARINNLNIKILALGKGKKNLEWAKRVVACYEQDIIPNEDILSEVKHYDKFEAFIVEAEPFLEAENKRVQAENEKKKEREAIERKKRVQELDAKRAERKQVYVKAHEIDEEIKMLDYSERNLAWCKKIDEVYAKMDEFDSEVKKLCTNLRLLDELRSQIPLIMKLTKVEEEFKHINPSNGLDKDRDWCNEVLAFINSIDKSSDFYINNKGWINKIYADVDKAKKAVSLITEDRKIQQLLDANYRREHAKEIQEQEELEKQKKLEEEKRLERELKEKEKQEKLRIQEEKRKQQLKLEEEKQTKLQAELDTRKEYVDSIVREAGELKLKCEERDNKITIFGYEKKIGAVIKIPDGVEVIDDFAFANCKNIVDVYIPSSVTSIREYAFEKCKKLTSVISDSEMNFIDRFTFKNCKKLKTIVANNVTSVEECAFDGCVNLKAVEMERLKFVGEYGFNGCKSLVSIKSKQNIEYRDGAFNGCRRLNNETRYLIMRR